MTEYDRLQLEIANLSDKVDDKFNAIENRLYQIIDALNGPNGVITKVELAKQSLNRVWWFIGTLVGGFFAMVFFILRNSLK